MVMKLLARRADCQNRCHPTVVEEDADAGAGEPVDPDPVVPTVGAN
jgi:hypothetical protein